MIYLFIYLVGVIIAYYILASQEEKLKSKIASKYYHTVIILFALFSWGFVLTSKNVLEE